VAAYFAYHAIRLGNREALQHAFQNDDFSGVKLTAAMAVENVAREFAQIRHDHN